MKPRAVLLAVLLMLDHLITQQPATVFFLTLWASGAVMWVGAGAPLW